MPAPEPLSPHAQLAEEIIGKLVQASSPAVSPDGRQVAFVVNRVSFEKNKGFSQVWVADTGGGGAPRPISGGDHDSSPAWSPDGRELAFVSRRGERKGDATLHVLPVGGGETRRVATTKEGIGDVQFSPDGRWIAFTSRTPDARYEAEDESWQAPRRIDTFLTRLNGEGWTFDRPQHAYVVPADGTAPARNLTPGPFELGAICWLADSSGLVGSSARHDDWDRDFAVDLFTVSLGGDLRALTSQTGIYGSPAVSPDGTTVAFLGMDDSLTYPQNSRLGVISATGGEHRWASELLDRTFETTVGTVQPCWESDNAVLGTAEDRGQTHVVRVFTDGREPEWVTSGALTVRAMSARAGTIAVCASSVDRPADVYVLGAGGELTALTSFADRYVAELHPQGWERFAVQTTDGSAEIDAWIMRPDGFDASRTYPVILNVHGGPHAQYGETFFDEAQMQAAAGFATVLCNPRGSSGREQSWGQAIIGPLHPVAPGSGWGTVDVDDVLAVIDTALQRYPFCDLARVGMQGGSYGGYMATWLAGTTGTKFAAICSERAVNNLITEEFTSDCATMFSTEHGPTAFADPEEYARISPIRFARDIDVPMLIIHSEEDYRCPINQAEELFVALRLQRKDVTFYRFPGETHELSRSGSPVHRRQRAEIILDFFARHLGADDAVAAADQPSATAHTSP